MTDIPEDIAELSQKIAALKEKNIPKEVETLKHTGFSHASLGMRLVVDIVSGTFVGAAIGHILDEMFDFKFLMLLIFIIFGSFAGVLNAYRYIKSIETAANEKRG